MDATVANEPNWHYLFRRPLALPTEQQAEHGVVYGDCSFGCKDLCFLAGIPDPTGYGYSSGYGNSTAIYGHLPHVAFEAIQVGDIVLFGVEGNHHAAMVYSVGKTAETTRVWSFGSESGPKIYTLADEMAYHKGQPVTFCQTIPADPSAPADAPHWYVVALTQPPLWAWINWRDHGHPPRWRPPQCPRLIPPWWWGRLRIHQRGGDKPK